MIRKKIIVGIGAAALFFAGVEVGALPNPLGKSPSFLKINSVTVKKTSAATEGQALVADGKALSKWANVEGVHVASNSAGSPVVSGSVLTADGTGKANWGGIDGIGVSSNVSGSAAPTGTVLTANGNGMTKWTNVEGLDVLSDVAGGAAANGTFLSANGAGRTKWSAVEGEGVASNSAGNPVANGTVLTANGTGAAKWTNVEGVTVASHVGAASVTSGAVLTANGAGGAAWSVTPSVSTLDVQSDIRVGPNKEFHVPVAEESLRIVRGVVSGAGGVLVGSGFTVTKGAAASGVYTLTFNPPFNGAPTVTATADLDGRVISTVGVTSTTANFQISVVNGAHTDAAFHVIAIGPR